MCKCCIIIYSHCPKPIKNIKTFHMDMLCIVLSLTKLTKFEILAIFHQTEEVCCITREFFSLANADASYQCHYIILAFTVSVVLMSVNP